MTVKVVVPIPPVVRSVAVRVSAPTGAVAGTVNTQVKPPVGFVLMVPGVKEEPPEHDVGVSVPATPLIATVAEALAVNPVPVTVNDVPCGSWVGLRVRPTVEIARVAEALWSAGLPAVALAATV